MKDEIKSKLIREFLEKMELLEKKVAKKSKKDKSEEKADKDYDGDGEVESSKDEYFGSKDKAIKKAMGKKEIVSKKKKKVLKEGTEVTDGNFTYGGFPRVLKEAEYKIPANPREEAENEDNPATVGMDEMFKILSGGGHPLMAGQSKVGNRGVPDEIRKQAIAHIETLRKHPKGAVEGYGPEHRFYKEAMDAHTFFKTHFPDFGVEEQIASEYNLG